MNAATEVEGTPRDLRTADQFREACPPELSVPSTVGVLSPDPLAAVVRNLLKEGGGAEDPEMQACLLLTKVADAMLAHGVV